LCAASNSNRESPLRAGPADLARLLPAAPAALDAGLPALLNRSEKDWLEKALRAHPKLKISEPALYKKLKEHGLGGRGE